MNKCTRKQSLSLWGQCIRTSLRLPLAAPPPPVRRQAPVRASVFRVWLALARAHRRRLCHCHCVGPRVVRRGSRVEPLIACGVRAYAEEDERATERSVQSELKRRSGDVIYPGGCMKTLAGQQPAGLCFFSFPDTPTATFTPSHEPRSGSTNTAPILLSF